MIIEYQVMPFDVINSLAIFMDYMNNIFCSFLDHFVVAFVDDLLIYSKIIKEEEEHRRTILQILKDKQCM